MISTIIAIILLNPVTVKAVPQNSLAPAKVTITLTIDPDPLNREVCLGYVSEDGNQSDLSCWDLNEYSPKTTQKVWKSLPRGHYLVHVTVGRVDKTISRATTFFEVWGPDKRGGK